MSSWINGNLVGTLSVGQGERGKSLEYVWRGTELGIRVEGEEEYQFVNLASGGTGSSGADGREIELQVGNGYIQWRYKDEEEWNNLISIDSLKGEPGPQGLPGRDGVDGLNGENGKSLEYNWNGTKLGVRREGDNSYSYVDLRGRDGQDGKNGVDGKQGPQGLPGRDGVDGKDGKNGIDGTNGQDGVTPNISIGTVTTLEAGEKATVTREGTKENPVFNFGIPKGKDGTPTGGSVDDTVVTIPIIGNTLTLTTDKRQKTTMQNNTTIVLPNVDKFTEIHLFFSTTEELTLIFPSIKWQSDITIEANKTYEFIFTYIDNSWLGGVISYNE